MFTPKRRLGVAVLGGALLLPLVPAAPAAAANGLLVNSVTKTGDLVHINISYNCDKPVDRVLGVAFKDQDNLATKTAVPKCDGVTHKADLKAVVKKGAIAKGDKVHVVAELYHQVDKTTKTVYVQKLRTLTVQ
ncbi:hypothetical protein MF672_013695 [Actinomadura sp. ATCC 31491]|uniref:Uncharacterized protein n=1 Tax=Actinomadura luzonensis TaxID=2805427 RepID=A0ABT0FR99_9ACTN|nr:hypothetical protein [Actinomadura luzonensis]MCK2214837.1 hypothetical protein [Actinomadura luzonensis]